MFIPATKKEMMDAGWTKPDVILVTGDSYIDNPYIGIAVIGKVLIDAGYKVAIIAQPDINSEEDIMKFGEPELFWGVSAGCVDSMVANYTPLKKFRKNDDYTPGGQNNARPDRATIKYSNLIRRYFKNTRPIVLGGIEASLRRISHYDFWSNKIRKSVLFDAKADIIVYGMGERAVLELASSLKNRKDYQDIRGICYISKEKKEGYLDLPSHQTILTSKEKFISMFHLFYDNNDPITARGLIQKTDTRYLIQNPPAFYLSQEELDRIYELDFERKQHPVSKKKGRVKALDTIGFSIPSHRGCYGECNFCAIAVHEGRTIRWRSEKSILQEAERFQSHPDFKGIVNDVGGPTANMYGFECKKKLEKGICNHKRCVFPEICPTLKPNHLKQISLLKKLKKIKGIRKVFVASGIRYDMVQEDRKHGNNYLQEIVNHHVSGQLKIAPEHISRKVLDIMGKPDSRSLLWFREKFFKFSKKAGKNQFLTYYFIAAHPGCTENDMRDLNKFISKNLKINPEQVQIFTPTPSTYSALMYYTETDPFTGKKIFVEKDHLKKEKQKKIITSKRRN